MKIWVIEQRHEDGAWRPRTIDGEAAEAFISRATARLHARIARRFTQPGAKLRVRPYHSEARG